MFDVGSIAVSVVFSLIASVVAIIVSTRKIIMPAVEGLLAEKFETAEGAIKRGYSAMGVKSQQIQSEKRMESAIAEGIFEEYPEILALAEKVSPDLVEMMEDDPETALKLASRYLPTLKGLFPDFFAKFEKEGQNKTLYEF